MQFDRAVVSHVKGAVGVAVGVVVPVPEAAVPLLAHIVAERLEKQLNLQKRSIFSSKDFYKVHFALLSNENKCCWRIFLQLQSQLLAVK